MSENKIKKSCSLCQTGLFDEDDVVHCPVCGAPHHRECYNSLGHCALEEFHGTDKEYRPHSEPEEEPTPVAEEPKKTNSALVTCPVCKKQYSANEPRCPYCAAPSGSPNFITFDFLGGVAPDYKFEEGVTANDVKKFVLTNTHRYIPKFVTLSKKNKTSWNWLAFLFPHAWLLSRKMIKEGVVASILFIISTLLSYPLAIGFTSLGYTTYSDILANSEYVYSTVGNGAIYLAVASLVINLIIRLFFGLFGDFIYKQHVISNIKKIKADDKTDEKVKEFFYRKKGGVNILNFMLGYLSVNYLSVIIVNLIL